MSTKNQELENEIERVKAKKVELTRKETNPSQTVKEQLQVVSIKGILLGTITLKSSFKEVQELIKKSNHYSTFWISKNDERVIDYDMLSISESEFPITAWMFPTSLSIKEGVYEDLPF